MIEESERVLSEIKSGEVGKDLFLVMVKARIWRYETFKSWGKRELIYENPGFTVECFIKWKWFFKYLAAKEQVKTPKQLIVLESVSYVTPDRKKVMLKVLNNRLSAAKRERTKIIMGIENATQTATSLFSPEEDPMYKLAIEKLQSKQDRIDQLESEIKSLTA